MSIYKKIAIGLISVLLVGIFLNIGLNYWIKKQLPIIMHVESFDPKLRPLAPNGTGH